MDHRVIILKNHSRMQVAIPLSKHGEPLFRQIYQALRRAILSGAFSGNARLPSTRDLAEQLGVSRTIVVLAYEQLLVDGLVTGRGGSGTFVAEHVKPNVEGRSKKLVNLPLSNFGRVAAGIAADENLTGKRQHSHRYDFQFGRSESDIESFPFAKWERMLLRHARRASVSQIDYGPPAGAPALQKAVCSLLRRSRGVICDPSDIVIVSGSQQALDLIVRVLLDVTDRVIIENPGYQGTTQILRAAGVRISPVTVDREGLNPSQLPNEARLCFVTPSHQFPTGVALPMDRRVALIQWAQRSNCIIVEDDYDGEFCYEGQPLEPLQCIDEQGRVIYVGTFSRTMFPALRVGYLVLPKSLVGAFTGAKWLNDQHSVTLEQHALAEFITTGAYERHLWRVRRRNAARRRTLLEAIDQYIGDRVEVTGQAAGAHVVLWPRRVAKEENLVAKAASCGVGVYGIARYFIGGQRTGIILGYARLREREIREGIRRLSGIV